MIPDWLARHLEPYAGVVRGGCRLDALIREQVHADLLPGSRQLGLLVLRPDCLIAGQAAAVLDVLEDEHGVVPLRMRILWLQPHLFDALYRFKLPLIGANVWLGHEVWRQAPAAIVLVGGQARGFESLSHRLDDLKGPSSPIQGTGPLGLRERFGRRSSLHAMIHVAADPGALFYEATLLFPWSALREALRWLAEGEVPRSPPPGLVRENRRVLLSFPTPGSRSVFATIAATKRKILASLRMGPDGRDADRFEELSDILAGFDPAEDARYGDQRDAFLAMVRAEREPLRALIAEYEKECPRGMERALSVSPSSTFQDRWQAAERALGRLLMLYASWHLSGHDAYGLDEGEALFEVLATNDVPLLPWEKSLIRSGLHCDVNRDASWAGQRLFPLD
jgi:hypothetical protein